MSSALPQKSCLLLAVALALANCRKPQVATGVVREARLGVFYGGQVQQREEVPRVLDAAKQLQGFRLVFHAPLASDTPVRWQIEQPAGKRALYVSRLGQSVARKGQEILDQVFRFEPDDPLGLWNIRVYVADELVIDRPWLVFDPVARRRASQR